MNIYRQKIGYSNNKKLKSSNKTKKKSVCPKRFHCVPLTLSRHYFNANYKRIPVHLDFGIWNMEPVRVLFSFLYRNVTYTDCSSGGAGGVRVTVISVVL